MAADEKSTEAATASDEVKKNTTWGNVWAALNSPFVLTIVGGIAIALITQLVQASFAKRDRAENSRKELLQKQLDFVATGFSDMDSSFSLILDSQARRLGWFRDMTGLSHISPGKHPPIPTDRFLSEEYLQKNEKQQYTMWREDMMAFTGRPTVNGRLMQAESLFRSSPVHKDINNLIDLTMSLPDIKSDAELRLMGPRYTALTRALADDMCKEMRDESDLIK